MVLHGDIQEATAFHKLFGECDILCTGAELSGRMIVAEDHGTGAFLQRLPENELRIGHGAVHAPAGERPAYSLDDED